MGFSKRRRCSSSHPSLTHRFLLTVEVLESRTVPYATIGAWPHPELVTLSFMPDGTSLGGSLYSNLFASLNAKWPTSVWQHQVLLAAQTWAQATNLNFAVVADDGLPFGWAAYQQGDPGEGDIRIGGFNFGTTDLLGGAWFPPPVNNYPVAGDLFLNTVQPFNIGSTFDLYTVATHELGHALGLLHSADYNAAMYGAYVGIKSYGLMADDVAGIRSLYSAGAPRAADGFGFYTNSFPTAADLTGAFDATTQTLVGGYLDLTTPGQAEYYRFLAPYGASSQLTVTIQSSGLSLLSPYVVLYDAYQRPIAAASGYGQGGTTISVTVGGVVPTQLFWLRVSGAEATPLGTGRYALIVNFGTSPSPTVRPPTTATLNGVPSVGIGGWPEQAGAVGPDGHGFDSFDVTPEAIARARQDDSAPGAVRDEPGLARGSVSVTAALLHPVNDQPSHGSLVVVAVQPAPTVVVSGVVAIFPSPLLDSRVAQSAEARTESGGGNNGASLAELEFPEEGASSPPERPPNVPNTEQPKLSSLAPEWRAACTALFMEKAGTGRQNSGGAPAPSAGTVVTSPGLDSTAALAGLTVVLGGYWGGQRGDGHGWRKAPLWLLAGIQK